MLASAAADHHHALSVSHEEHYGGTPGGPWSTTHELTRNRGLLVGFTFSTHFGLRAPALRSSELWTDPRFVTVPVDAERELDLVLFNHVHDAYGAHVGVVVGRDAVLHLTAELGMPVVWPTTTFLERAQYAVRVGARRLVA